MAKTYILEPTEVTFEEEIGATLERDNLDGVYESITDGSIIEFSGTKLKYAGVVNNAKGFTPDGTMPQSEPENWANIIFQDGVFDNPSKLYIYYKHTGTFTVSIYTETEDEDPGSGLVKNVIHNDHPYNDVEAFLAKQGDPKTGYNTVEKISNATISGGGGETGGAQIIYATVTTEDGQTYTCDHDGEELIQTIENGGMVLIVDEVDYHGVGIAYKTETGLTADICYSYVYNSEIAVAGAFIEYSAIFGLWSYRQ